MRNTTLLFILFTFFSLNAHGDGRRYVWNYEYQTLPKGHAEIESYTEFSHLETDSVMSTQNKLQVEAEIGMNDRFDVGLYQVFMQADDSPLTFDGFKIRFRYRLGEAGKYFMDPLVYLEYKDNTAFDDTALEAKLILAKDVGPLNLVVNPVIEIEFHDETEVEWEYTAGLSYQLHALLSLGLETKGSGHSFYWGPTLSHGKEDLWFASGVLFKGSGEGKPDRTYRFIIGLGI